MNANLLSSFADFTAACMIVGAKGLSASLIDSRACSIVSNDILQDTDELTQAVGEQKCVDKETHGQFDGQARGNREIVQRGENLRAHGASAAKNIDNGLGREQRRGMRTTYGAMIRDAQLQ